MTNDELKAWDAASEKVWSQITDEEAIEIVSKIRPAQAYDDSPLYRRNKLAIDRVIALARSAEPSRAAVEAAKNLMAELDKCGVRSVICDTNIFYFSNILAEQLSVLAAKQGSERL